MPLDDRELPGRGLFGTDVLVRTRDGRSLRTIVAGDGPDLVVLEAGLGASGLYWGPVHERIAPHARVVAYERSGFGASDPDPARRSLKRLADDLEDVIAAFDPARLVLVGHSWGGAIVRAVAARRLFAGLPPTGVVLVDQADEHSDLYFSPLTRAMDAMQGPLFVGLARVGLLPKLAAAAVPGLSAELRKAIASAIGSVGGARAARQELAGYRAGLAALRVRAAWLGAVPIRVLSGGESTWLDHGIRRDIAAAHRATADAWPGARLIIAEHSGHLIPLTEPDLVAQQVLDLLGR